MWGDRPSPPRAPVRRSVWLRPEATLLRSKEAAPRRRQELVFIGCGLDREGIEARAPRRVPAPAAAPLRRSPAAPSCEAARVCKPTSEKRLV